METMCFTLSVGQKFTLGCSGEVLMPGLSPAPPMVLSHGDTPILLLLPSREMEQRRLSRLQESPRCCKERQS